MFGDKRVEKKKTPIYKCNLNPIFNATVITICRFRFPINELSHEFGHLHLRSFCLIIVSKIQKQTPFFVTKTY